MKKLVSFFLSFFIIIGFVIVLGACNNPTDSEPQDKDAEDVDLTFEGDGDGDGTGQLFVMEGEDTDYPGLEITLKGIMDISKYSQVIIDATLYSDAEGTTKADEPTGDNDNLAQCKLLKAPGGTNWDTASNNVCANGYTKYAMTIDGETTMDIPTGSSGVPTILLVQANWENNKDAVKSIKVRSIKFVAKKTGSGPVITDGGLYVMANSDNYPGAEVDLTKFLGETLNDISQYASVIVDATLYSDAAGETRAVKENTSDNLAQFKLLKATGDWNNNNNICSDTKYNMALDGKNTLDIKASNTGVPAVLLLQANWEEFPNAVKSIRVKTIEFTLKTGDVVLSHLYPDGDTTHMEVSGNQVTFKNAMYSDCAALYAFPAEWGGTETSSDALKNKTITFTYSIPAHTCVPAGNPPVDATIEHQIHIQAAHDDSSKDKFNGRNDQPGQKYITLASTGGSFPVPANDLISASGVTGNANDIKGPFVLNAVRIANNGTEWNESGVGIHYRCKSYTLVFNSITISP